ncbi:hypothetical protein DPMN_151511 [Dreissena polymorpha]|uniref:Uncharacterized protein n=1 Tax=Dreissena polymorpha TaxID=45954 RepID=A0A9D4FJN3_DREPO|nr:hypothetical protein DPMN_151511 [Dreissena polymorpha]
MYISELARQSPQIDIRDICRLSMYEQAPHSFQLDIRDFVQCRCQSWLDIAPAQYSKLLPNVDVRADNDIRPRLICGISAEYRCHS